MLDGPEDIQYYRVVVGYMHSLFGHFASYGRSGLEFARRCGFQLGALAFIAGALLALGPGQESA